MKKMTSLLKDLRYAFRMLKKSPGFTVVAVVSLSLGIGANTAIFSVINQVLLKPLPYPEADRIVAVLRQAPEDPNPSNFAFFWSYPKFRILAEENNLFEHVAAVAQQAYAITGTESEAQRVQVEFVSASYFPLLSVEAVVGRTFLPEEDTKPASHPVALVSHDLWRSQFGREAKVVGRTIRLDNKPLTVVGVLPQGFKGQTGVVDVWVPMMMAPVLMFPQRLENRNSHWHEVVGKLKPDISLAEANAQAGQPARGISEEVGRPFGGDSEEPGLRIMPLQQANLDPAIRRSMLVALGAVGFVLLIACANVANVFLARSTSRTQEIATRLALGASRPRLVQQFFTEALLLAFLGGFVGLILAMWGAPFLSSIQPSSDPIFRAKDVQILGFSGAGLDLNVLGFNLAVSALTALMFGILPSLRLPGLPLCATLRNAAAGRASSGLAHSHSRRLLVVAQITFTLVLLVCAGLMIHSLVRLRLTDGGFDPDGVLTLRIHQPLGFSQADFSEQLLQKVSILPGVASASLSSCTPLSSNSSGTVIKVTGWDQTPLGDLPVVQTHVVSSDYFRTLGIPLVKGRTFSGADREGAPRVVMINRKAAGQFWPGEEAIGKRLWLGVGWEDRELAEVVGVVGDVRYGRIEEAVEASVYLPHLQPIEPACFLLVKSQFPPSTMIPALRKTIGSIDRNLPVHDVRTMEQRAAEASSRTSFSAVLLACFAALSLALSAVGVYGVTAYITSARSKEIGIRMALGARGKDVVLMLVREGVSLVLLGIILGAGLSLAATRVLQGQLYEVGTNDPLTFAAVIVLLAIIGLTACYIPARAASRSNPAAVLRFE
jgi:putative ABC transport system permease protein